MSQMIYGTQNIANGNKSRNLYVMVILVVNSTDHMVIHLNELSLITLRSLRTKNMRLLPKSLMTIPKSLMKILLRVPMIQVKA